MRASALIAALLAAALPAANALAQTIGPVNPGAEVKVSAPTSETINGVPGVRVRATPGAQQGYMVPDGAGGYINYQPGPPPAPLPASRGDAEEVRLYTRELASQITTGITGNVPLSGVVSIPSAFVDQDSRLTSPFGRLMGEQMIYELNSRGFPVQEARGKVPVAQSRKGKQPSSVYAVLAGSYYVDRENLFVNARLVEPSGRVLRTGSVVIPMTPTLRRMLGLPDPDPSGLRPVLPTLIGSRDVNDPPAGPAKTPAPFTPSPAKKPVAKKKVAAAKKPPCPPGCEPIDTNMKKAAAAPATGPAQASEPKPAPQQQPAAPAPAQ